MWLHSSTDTKRVLIARENWNLARFGIIRWGNLLGHRFAHVLVVNKDLVAAFERVSGELDFLLTVTLMDSFVSMFIFDMGSHAI